MDKIKQLQHDLDDNQIDRFFCVYYDAAYYWGKALHVSISWRLTFLQVINHQKQAWAE